MFTRLLLLLIFLLFSWIPVGAQVVPAEKEDVIKVDTQLVEIPVVITDKTGRPLLNLKQNNFVIYEDGKPQEILDFSTTSAPFEVALLLDTSGSTRQDLQLIQRAVESFVASLRPGDRVALISYKQAAPNQATSEILTNLTSNRAALAEVLLHDLACQSLASQAARVRRCRAA